MELMRNNTLIFLILKSTEKFSGKKSNGILKKVKKYFKKAAKTFDLPNKIRYNVVKFSKESIFLLFYELFPYDKQTAI